MCQVWISPRSVCFVYLGKMLDPSWWMGSLEKYSIMYSSALYMYYFGGVRKYFLFNRKTTIVRFNHCLNEPAMQNICVKTVQNNSKIHKTELQRLSKYELISVFMDS